MMKPHTARSRGFTLIELMITVAVIAILAAIAYPSYIEQVAKGRRTEAKSILSESSQWMERFYAENYRYDRNTAGTAVTDAQLFAGRFTQSPKVGTASYTIAVSAASDVAYTLKATRTGSMASDSCGDFTITQTGLKAVVSSGSKYANDTAASAECWK